jgi:hypothetical protein
MVCQRIEIFESAPAFSRRENISIAPAVVKSQKSRRDGIIVVRQLARAIKPIDVIPDGINFTSRAISTEMFSLRENALAIPARLFL